MKVSEFFALFRGEPIMKKFPTREEFIASYLRQRFSLPDSMIYYITKNPQSSKCYQKMIQACKHFYIKNPILVFHCLQIDDDVWTGCSEETCNDHYVTQKFNITTEKLMGCKIWIQNSINFHSTQSSSNAASYLIPKIYQCDAGCFIATRQRLSFEQFLFYSKNVKSCTLIKTYLYSKSDSEISIETLIASLPNLQHFGYEFLPTSKNVSTNTVKNLLQITHFKNLDSFLMYKLSEDFDIDTFYDYYKKNKHMDCVIAYKEMPSPDYALKLAAIVDEILDDVFLFWTSKPLGIAYPGQLLSKFGTLFEMREL